MSKSQRPKEEIHMGKLLKRLAEWYGDSNADFVNAIKRSEKWFYDNIKLERLDSKNILNIYKKLGIPESYWEGKYELPARGIVNEPQVSYQAMKIQLEEENRKLKEENRKLLEEIRHLHERLIVKLDEKIQEHDNEQSAP